MNKKYLNKLLIVLTSTLFLIGCGPKLEQIPQDKKIVAFGDSLTFGYGTSQDKSYPIQLGKLINREVVNEGINGNTTRDGLNRINKVLTEHQPHTVLVSLGGNDMLRKYSVEETEKNLKEIIDTIQAKNIQVILIAEPQPSLMGAMLKLNDADIYEKVAKEMKVPLIEDVFSTYLSKQEYKSDVIHLNEQGYKLVAQDIAKYLEKYEAIKN